MRQGLSDPFTALSFSAMPVTELAEHHRGLMAAQRDIHHWRRLILARIDLAVAAVADLEEPLPPPNGDSFACACTPPPGLRDLLGIARLDAVDDRLAETAVLIRLREALADVEGYAAALDVVTDEAAQILAYRLDALA